MEDGHLPSVVRGERQERVGGPVTDEGRSGIACSWLCPRPREEGEAGVLAESIAVGTGSEDAWDGGEGVSMGTERRVMGGSVGGHVSGGPCRCTADVRQL